MREAAARAGAGQEVEVMSWSWGVSQSGWDRSKGSTATPSGDKLVAANYDGDGRADLAVAAGDVNGDGRADRSVKAPRDAASGMASGKRTHHPVTRGSVTVVGKFPACVRRGL